MAVTTTNLGVITAYGDAVAAGYTGTKAEWQALMASYATVGQQAVDAKDTAVAKATEATTAASTATTKASEASASAESIAQSAAQIQENTDDIDQLKSELNTEEARAKAEEARIEALFTGDVSEAVGDWLEEHPEATTTVQDGAITESKFANSVLPMFWNHSDVVRKPLVSFTSDDGSIADINVLAPILNAYGVPCTCALISGTLGHVEDYKTQVAQHGWEIASHSVNSTPLGDLTLDEVDANLRQSKQVLESNGFNISGFVYPSGSANANIRRIAKKYYQNGYGYDDKVNNDLFLDSFSIHRVPLGAFYTTASHNTLEYYKSCVDSAVEKNGWCIFCLHPYADTFDSTQQGYLADLIEYIQGLGVETVTLSEGYKVFGNIVEAGKSYNSPTEDEYERFVVRNDGVCNLPAFFAKQNTITPDLVPSDFRNRCVTIGYMSRYINDQFPDNVSGVSVTMRTVDITNQLWFPVNSNRIFKRVSSNETAFGAWFLITPTVDKSNDNLYSASYGKTSLASEKITITEITSGTSLGFPANEGTLISKRFTHYTEQYFIPFGSEDVLHRYWKDTSNAWSDFINISGHKDTIFNAITAVTTNYKAIPIKITNNLYIDKFISTEGTTPTLTKQYWAANEISDDSSNPTVLGTAGSTRTLQAYKTANSLYVKYSTVGNNYQCVISMMSR